MNWATAVTVGTPIGVAILGVAATIWGKRLSKRTDEATARKTNAEAVSIEVATARGLVEDVKKLMADQRAEYESRLAETRTSLSGLSAQVQDVGMRQQILLAALAAHAPWDEAALAALRQRMPEYPPPPPLQPQKELS